MGDDRQLTEHGRRGRALRGAHLPDVAVLLRLWLLRPPAVPSWRRPRILGEPAKANPRATGCRLADPVSGDCGCVGMGTDADLRRHAARGAGQHARASTRRVPMDAPLVPLLPARPLRNGPGGQGDRRRARSARIVKARSRCFRPPAPQHRNCGCADRIAGCSRIVPSPGLDRLVRNPDARSLDHSRARLADRIWGCCVVRLVDSPAVGPARSLGPSVARAPCRCARRHGGVPFARRHQAGIRSVCPGECKAGARTRLLDQHLVLVTGHPRNGDPVPVARQRSHPVCCGCFLLDLPDTPAGRGCAPNHGWQAALALERQVPADSRRQPDRAVRELSLSRPIDVDR